MGRNAIGVDISYEACTLASDVLNLNRSLIGSDWEEPNSVFNHGDARNLNLVEDESVDLIATHPPYANIIPYSKQKEIEVPSPKFTT
ncbi:MAG: hypothetical protein QW461_09885 [Candidatus Jordarchaeales archaeon]